MRFLKAFSTKIFPSLALVFTLSVIALAQGYERNFANIKIKNFGQMDERFYRGARPQPDDLQALKGLGVKTIIDLTDNSKDYEQAAVEAAGMRYVNIPMADKSYPSSEQINEFLKVVDDPSTGKFFVHCAGGRHRTGVVGAVYRFTHNQWTYDQAVAEMNRFEFGSGFVTASRRILSKTTGNNSRQNRRAKPLQQLLFTRGRSLASKRKVA